MSRIRRSASSSCRGRRPARVHADAPDPDLEMPSTHQVEPDSIERGMPWSTRRCASATSGNHNDKRLRYAQDNLPLSPLNGPVTRRQSSEQRARGRFPGSAWQDDRPHRRRRPRAPAPAFPASRSTRRCPNVVPIADNEISLRVPRTNERRPDPRYTTNLLISNDAEDLVRRPADRMGQAAVAAACSSRAATPAADREDTTSEATFVGAGDTQPARVRTSSSRRGYSRFHTPHRFTFNGSYRLPFLQDRPDLLGLLVGGWQVSGVVQARVRHAVHRHDTAASDLDFDGFAENRPMLLDRSILGSVVGDPATSTQILTRDKFRTAQFGEGDRVVGRNTFFGDGQATVDLGLYKTFRMPWRHNLTVRFEAFNAFNSVRSASRRRTSRT